MNTDILEGKWKELKGKAQQQWGRLTEDDLDMIDGKSTELIGRIQARYGASKSEAKTQFQQWLDRL